MTLPLNTAADPASPQPNSKRERLERRRSVAKWGMAAAMGALVVTGYFRRNPTARLAHIAAGAALLGLSYWHQTLYTNDPRRSL